MGEKQASINHVSTIRSIGLIWLHHVLPPFLSIPMEGTVLKGMASGTYLWLGCVARWLTSLVEDK